LAEIIWKAPHIACKERFGGDLLVRFVFAHRGFAESRCWSRIAIQWLAAMRRGARMDKPSREQFAIGPYQVQHLPTGAKFGAYPGHRDICYIDWGRLSKQFIAQDYCEELRKIARELLRERSKF
jgi:hypothetical protein